jgi:hypothetical protein
MRSLLILAAILVACWAWATWKRSSSARFMQEWSYALLVAAASCVVMAIGIWLR